MNERMGIIYHEIKALKELLGCWGQTRNRRSLTQNENNEKYGNKSGLR